MSQELRGGAVFTPAEIKGEEYLPNKGVFLSNMFGKQTGHAFGLRHNFAASTLYTQAQLRSGAFTARHGVSSGEGTEVLQSLRRILGPRGKAKRRSRRVSGR